MRRRVLAVCGGGLAGAALVVGLHDMVNLGGGNASAARTTLARLASVAGLPIMRLTHRGRKTGAAHEVTIWFVVDGEVVYLTTMDRSRQWVRNVIHTPQVELQIGPERFAGTVTPVTAAAEKRREYELLTRKYWSMRLMDGARRLTGRDRGQGLDLGRGGFFRVELGPDQPGS